MPQRADGSSLLDVLDQRSADGLGTYLSYDVSGRDHRELTTRQLRQTSQAVAAGLYGLWLRRRPGRPASHVLIVTQDPLSFIISFFATMRAGLVPVPGPSRPLAHRGHLQRLGSIIKSTLPLVTITDPETVASLAEILERRVAVRDLDALTESGPVPLAGVTVDPVAYVQYTSGSLAEPKPIRLRHRHVRGQLAQAAEAFEESREAAAVSWVPLHHDMGLVTGVLRPLWSGYTSVLIDPLDFVRDPAVWPRAMSEWRATHTSAPDFGYRLCARKTTDPGRFDLRPLRVARSAGEPVRAGTLRDFADAFAAAGFDYAAFAPSYGLAEATLTVTTTAVAEAPTILTVSRKAFQDGQVGPVDRATERSVEVVSCGRPLRHTRVEVVDPMSRTVLGPDRIGEVWISGPQVVLDGSAHEIAGIEGCLTGDIGFTHQGELYLIGRSAERFQYGGENYYSNDIEAVAGGVDPLRPGRVAAFLGQLSHWPEPAPVVVAECREPTAELAGYADLAKAVVKAVGHGVGLSVRCVCLVPAGALELTTSGKLQRERCQEAFEAGALRPVYQYERVSR